MVHDEILTRLERVFADVFSLPRFELSDTTRRDDVPDWDSLANIRLLMAVEEEFGIHFSSRHIADIQDVPDLVTAVSTRTAAPSAALRA